MSYQNNRVMNMKFIKNTLPVLLIVGLLYSVMFLLGITCPIKWLFGISCPGCGMSRALMNAVLFNFDTAFSFHPLWILLLPSTIALALLYIKKCKRCFNILLSILFAVMIFVYALRMFSDSSIVVFEPENSIFARIIEHFISLFK